jgi:hypothetical protein
MMAGAERTKPKRRARSSGLSCPAVKNSLNPTYKFKLHCASFVNRRWSIMLLLQGTGACATSPPQLIGSII